LLCMPDPIGGIGAERTQLTPEVTVKVATSITNSLAGRLPTRSRGPAWMVTALLLLALPASEAGAAIAYRDDSSTSVNTATSINATRPAGTLADDVMVAAIAVRGGTGTTITPPLGWTLVRRTDSTTTISQAIYWKLAGTPGADPGPYPSATR
jgi:hypothetical protein